MVTDFQLDNEPHKILNESNKEIKFSQKCKRCGHSRAAHLVQSLQSITVHAVSDCNQCDCNQFASVMLIDFDEKEKKHDTSTTDTG